MSAFEDWFNEYKFSPESRIFTSERPYHMKAAFNAGMEHAAEESCKRGARMQLLKEFLQSRKCNSSLNYWEQYCNINPDAEKWFDNDGVPSND